MRERYAIERELGRGGMAIVYLARDLRHDRLVALKTLRPELAHALGPERFLREIQIAARLQHPNILPLHDSGEVDGLLYYVMPYVEGESLRARIEREGQLPIEDALRIAHQVAEALAYAHSHGVVHRDIKPENILLSGDHALVADFGIARAITAAGGERLTETGLAVGTAAYMSPEQAAAEPRVDGRSDIYSLGCVVYEMLIGEPPFTGPTAQAVVARKLTESPRSLRTVRESVPEAVERVVLKALAKSPADRFAAAAEFAAALSLPAPLSMLPRAPATRRRHVAVAVLIFVTLTSFALWRLGPRAVQPSVNPQLVAVLPFRVSGSDPSLHYLRQGMIDLMVAKLTGEGGPRAADARSVLAALRSVADTSDADVPERAALKVARKVGAGRILQGSVVGPPEHIVITASLVGEVGIGTKQQATVEGPKDSLFVLVDRLTAELLALGAGANTQQLSSLTTTSLEALRAYLDGQAAYRRGAFAEANQLLERALQLDSTFALAASGRVEAGSWVAYGDVDRARRLAWKYRDRLSERDKLLLSVRLGPRYPLWSPANMGIEAAERLTQVMPESPDAWFKVGDMLFHNGLLAGIPDARQRAGVVLQRALDRDSLFAPALAHLVSLAAERGDSTELKQLVPRLLALDSTDWTAWAARWNLAAARLDKGAMSSIVASLASGHPLHTLNQARDQLGDSTGLAHLDAFLAAARPLLTTSGERAQYALLAWVQAVNRGRPNEARKWKDSTGLARSWSLAILGWLHGADTVNLEEAGRHEERLASARSQRGDLAYILFLKEASKLRRKDLSSVERTVHQFRRDPTLVDSVREDHLVAAQILEAWNAVVRQSPEGRKRLDAADSMLVGRGDLMTVEWLNPLIAHLYEQLGSRDRALAAIRRRLYHVTYIHPAGLAETSRLEGLWAAQTGDRTGAITAYRRYLMFRTNPEPSKIPQRDSVRAELAALERESTDR